MSNFNFSFKSRPAFYTLASLALAPSLLLVSPSAQAQELARIMSSTPILQSVAVPQNICRQEYVQTPVYNSGGGAILGALAGGIIGSQIGHGGGRAAATVLGTVGGAVVGNNIEGNSGYQTQSVQNCQTQTSYEQKIVGYDVSYGYRGQVHYTKLNYNPTTTYVNMNDLVQASSAYSNNYNSNYGQPIQSTVVPQSVYTPSTVTTSTTYYGAQPISVYPAYPVYQTYPAYPVYRSSYPSSSLNITIGNNRGYDRGHDRYRGHRYNRPDNRPRPW